jgi:hypothetical protein
MEGERFFFQIIYIEQIAILRIEKMKKTYNTTVLPLSSIVYRNDSQPTNLTVLSLSLNRAMEVVNSF